MSPTLRQLQFLCALADHGSFSRAAQAAFVTQPTLSAGIRELESILGHTLVDRGAKGGLSLTPFGTDAVKRARTILALTQDLTQAARVAQTPLSGSFRLGVIPTIAPFYLPHVLAATREKRPQLQLVLREDQTERLVDDLQTGTLDAAILALPYEADAIATVPLFDDPLCLLVSDDHPLAKCQQISAADLAPYPMLLLEDGHCLRDHVMATCQKIEGTQAIGLKAASLHTLAHLAASGLGITLAPQMAIDAGLTRGLDVAVVPFADPQPVRTIAIAWRAGGVHGADARMLADLLR